MNTEISWWYDEFKQVGRDYGDLSEVARYDASHADFRDIKDESNRVLDRIAVSEGDSIIDLGCGTGVFAIEAAQRGVRVHAVDISHAMLSHARAAVERERVDGVTFHHAGFLTHEHPEYTADAVVTTFALHHLPDFWKGVALGRIQRMLKPEGLFFIHDVIIEANDCIDKYCSIY